MGQLLAGGIITLFMMVFVVGLYLVTATSFTVVGVVLMTLPAMPALGAIVVYFGMGLYVRVKASRAHR